MKIFFLALSLVCSLAWSQAPKQKLGLVGIDSYSKETDPTRAARVELEKLGLYEIIDRYDIEYLLAQKEMKVDRCFGKLCLVEAGKAIKADKMCTGTVESFKDRIVVSLRIINVESSDIEQSVAVEFYDYPQEIDRMVEVAIKKLHGLTADSALVKQIVRPEKYETIINPPIVERLQLNGPRLGFTYFGGQTGARLQDPKTDGGFDAYPFMFQFGYQFETQYLNEGNLQALFEFIPLISGIDQGYFIPSLTVLHGLRNNRNGWEFALGPSITVVKEAKGFYDAEGKWQIEPEFAEGRDIIKRLDSRGTPGFRTGFVVALGKTIRSGRLSVPINVYFIPNRDGFRYGLSFGFNAKRD